MTSQPRRGNKRFRLLACAATALTSAVHLAPTARAGDVSAPVILQYIESSWQTMQKRMPDIFMAGYGAIWTPPPGRALYDDQGGGIGYNLYDRFDLGKAGDPTLYGTENSYRALINAMHQTNGDVYVDFVHHHVGAWDVPAYTGSNGWTPDPGAQVHDRSDYPGFELSDPYVGAASSDPNYRNYPGQRDTYPDPPPVNDGNTTQFQYQYRLAHLITIDLTSGRSFVRNPVPGNANDIRQAPAAWAIGTSTLLPNGKPGASTILRQANTPTDANRALYPDNSLPGITVTDPANGGGTYTIHPFNLADPSQGDPTSETPAGYIQRYAQWLVNDLGVDGLRIDAARHVPYGQSGDAYNPDNINVPALIDRAVYDESRRTNLDGSQRDVFSFQEVFTGDKSFNQQFVRKDINHSTPNVVGGNRDVLDFPLWFAMRNNFTGDGTHNNWYNVRGASQDSQDDGLANNGSEGIGFVINHDDGKGDSSNQNNDYIVLDNVAHAWVLTRPGNAYVYFNSHEFDRSGNTSFFLKDGRGDALGGQYGSIITNLLDIRNSYGRGNFQERWIDGGSSSAIYVYERMGSMVVGLNIGYNPGVATRTITTSFPAGTHLEEMTGNWQDSSGQVPHTITVGSGGSATISTPWNNAANGNKGYVVYGLPRPRGAVSLSNVSQTLAGSGTNSANNATSRIADVQVITANSFNVTLNTNKVTLSDSFHDNNADGDRAYLRLDGGLDLNGNGVVDYTSQGDTRYGFENFVTQNSPGYNANPSLSGNGQYVQTINTTGLSEGFHYLTARAYRHVSFTGEQDVFTDLKKVIYVDRLPPSSTISSIAQSGSGGGKTVSVDVTSLDDTADNVHVLMDLGAALTDSQVLAMLNSGTQSTQTDQDLFSKSFAGVINGTHVLTAVTREIDGNYSIIRATGLNTPGGNGAGFADLDANGVVNSTDISQFQTVLQSNNQQFNAGAEANTDGLVNLTDTFLLGPRLTAVGADAPTVIAYNNLIHTSTVTSGTFTVDANYSVYDVTAGTTNVQAGKTLSARSIRGQSLNLAGNATAQIQPRSSAGSNSALSAITIATGAKLDLADTGLVVHNGIVGTLNGSAYTDITGAVQSGRNGGNWNGTGIVTTQSAAHLSNYTTLGVAGASELNRVGTTFGGITLAAGDVLVMYTYGGDATLDGKINIDDYIKIDSGIASHLTGWINGDFNYDGKINIDDYTGFIDANIGTQGGVLGSASSASLDGITAIPEPAAFSLILAVGLPLASSRRRRRSARI